MIRLITPIISRYTAAIREFYRWFWLKVEEKMKPERVEYDAHVAELMVYGEEVFLTPDWIRQPGGEPPPGWNGARWRRRSLAEIRQRRSKLGHKSFRGISWTARAWLRWANTHGPGSICASRKPRVSASARVLPRDHFTDHRPSRSKNDF